MKQVKNTIDIQAPAAKVWDILTQPKYTTQYMFGCSTVSDWKAGDTLLWQMNHEGTMITPVSGKIVEIMPNIKLVYTVIDPSAPYEQTEANHLRVTYNLLQQDDYTSLEVIQDGFETAANGEQRYTDVYNNGEGWQPILDQIKQIAETEDLAN